MSRVSWKVKWEIFNFNNIFFIQITGLIRKREGIFPLALISFLSPLHSFSLLSMASCNLPSSVPHRRTCTGLGELETAKRLTRGVSAPDDVPHGPPVACGVTVLQLSRSFFSHLWWAFRLGHFQAQYFESSKTISTTFTELQLFFRQASTVNLWLSYPFLDKRQWFLRYRP